MRQRRLGCQNTALPRHTSLKPGGQLEEGGGAERAPNAVSQGGSKWRRFSVRETCGVRGKARGCVHQKVLWCSPDRVTGPRAHQLRAHQGRARTRTQRRYCRSPLGKAEGPALAALRASTPRLAQTGCAKLPRDPAEGLSCTAYIPFQRSRGGRASRRTVVSQFLSWSRRTVPTPPPREATGGPSAGGRGPRDSTDSESPLPPISAHRARRLPNRDTPCLARREDEAPAGKAPRASSPYDPGNLARPSRK